MSAVIKPQAQPAAVTATLAEWALARDTAQLPADVREAARRCVLDWMAVSLAGADDPLIRILIDTALEEGGNPRCTLVAQSEHVSPLQAALINGTTSHALDYDDVNLAMNGHPTAAVLPAILALAETRDSSGAEIIAAFIAGYETAARIGLLVRPRWAWNVGLWGRPHGLGNIAPVVEGKKRIVDYLNWTAKNFDHSVT